MKKIVRGNDFTLRVPVMKIVDGEKVAFPLPGCTDIKVNIVNQYRRVALGYTIDVSEDNVLLARVEGDKVAVGTYALEVKGKMFGNDWRSNEYEQFQIVDNNASGDTVFEPQEGEDSVEMDTALVVLAPAVELGNLIKDAEETIADTKEALKGVETKMGDIEQRADTAIGAATTAAERAHTAAEKTEQTNAAVENAEKERVAAEQERKTAEEQRKSQMQSNAEAEKARANAEQHRVEAEKRRASAETMRAAAEETRKTAEADRITGETSREKQEASRAAAEQTRDEQETRRKIDEAKRVDAENTRERMEADRANAETERVAAETIRAAAETSRADAETKRAATETKREMDFSTKIAEVDTAVKNAKTATSEAEKVDATITDANVLEVTGRDGVKKSLELVEQAEAATIKAGLAEKFDKANVAQELGEAEDKVVSQKVVSNKLSNLDDIIMGEYEYPTILSKKELKNGFYASNTACKVCIYDITKVAGTTITLDTEGTSWNSIDYAIVKDYSKIAETQSDYNEEVWDANRLEVVTIQGGPITKAIDLSSESIVNAAKEGSIYLVCNLLSAYDVTPLKKTIGLAENVELLKEKQEYAIYPSKIDGELSVTSTNTDYYYGNLGTHTTDLLVYGVRIRNPYAKKGVFIKKYDLLSQTLSDVCPVNGTNITNLEQIDVYFDEPILLKKSEILVINWYYIYRTNYVSAVVQPNTIYTLGNIKDDSILSLQYICEEISGKKTTDKNAVLFNSDMKSENIYIEKTSCQYSAKGLTFTEHGDANYIYLNKPYFSDKRFARFSVSMGSDTILIIPVANIKNKQNNIGGSSCFSVDFKNRKIVIYASGDGSDTQGGSSSFYDLKKELKTTELPEEFINNGEYIIEIHKNNTESSLVIFNVLSGESYSVSHDGWGAGRQNDYYSIYCQEGTFPTIRDFSVYSLNNPDVNEVGDSISEGVGVVDRSKRFTQQFRDSNKDKKIVISARGGATIVDVCSIFKSEFIYTNPKKISMLIGTNIGISNTNMYRLWALNKMVNAEITMHLTPASGEVNYKATNDNIRALAPKFGFKIGAKFDAATSIDYNPESGYNSDLFYDATHPDVNGQTKMFQRMKIDAPDLFYT